MRGRAGRSVVYRNARLQLQMHTLKHKKNGAVIQHGEVNHVRGTWGKRHVR